MNPEYVSKAEAELSRADPLLARLIQSQKLTLHEPRTDYFASLCHSIIGQQVSVAAATAIFGRFETLTELKPHKVLTLTEDEIKTIGLSKQKATYVTDLAQHFASNSAIYNHLETRTDDEVIEELTAVKGIGVWTAQMFLMFTLTRPDVFAPDDIGLQHGIQKLYGWKELPPKKELAALAEKWSPHRTVASWHLWQSLLDQ